MLISKAEAEAAVRGRRYRLTGVICRHKHGSTASVNILENGVPTTTKENGRKTRLIIRPTAEKYPANAVPWRGDGRCSSSSPGEGGSAVRARHYRSSVRGMEYRTVLVELFAAGLPRVIQREAVAKRCPTQKRRAVNGRRSLEGRIALIYPGHRQLNAPIG